MFKSLFVTVVCHSIFVKSLFVGANGAYNEGNARQARNAAIFNHIMKKNWSLFQSAVPSVLLFNLQSSL